MRAGPAKLITVVILSPEGRHVGTVEMRPTRALWRGDGAPSVYITRGRHEKRKVRCIHVGGSWQVQLESGENMPRGPLPEGKYLAGVST